MVSHSAGPRSVRRVGETVGRVGIGLLGCGVVGSAVVRALNEVAGADSLAINGVAVRDTEKPRECRLQRGLLTREADAVVDDPATKIVVEVIGGVDEAARLIARALDQGKPVVTANKEALGALGPELRARAAFSNASLRFEAAVAGTVPVIRGMSRLLQADDVFKVEGVLNGTTTFMLSYIEETGATIEEALVEANRLGYAETDPLRDLDGTDAADKLAILVQYLFGEDVRTNDIHRCGIDRLKPSDLRRNRDGRWRLMAAAVRGQCARVEPVLFRADHPFAQLSGPQSAVTVTGARSGATTFLGAGAGGEAAACSIIADVLAARDSVWSRAPHRVDRASTWIARTLPGVGLTVKTRTSSKALDLGAGVGG